MVKCIFIQTKSATLLGGVMRVPGHHNFITEGKLPDSIISLSYFRSRFCRVLFRRVSYPNISHF